MVDVNKGTFDAREGLQFVLHLLGQIMGLPQRCVTGHHDIDLNKVIGTALINQIF